MKEYCACIYYSIANFLLILNDYITDDVKAKMKYTQKPYTVILMCLRYRLCEWRFQTKLYAAHLFETFVHDIKSSFVFMELHQTHKFMLLICAFCQFWNSMHVRVCVIFIISVIDDILWMGKCLDINSK